MRQIIKCPRCLLDNREKILGELLGAGTVAIARQRNKWSYEDATIVIGNDFSLLCGYCRTIIQITKEVSYESSNQRIAWIFRVSFSQGSVRQEISDSENRSGSIIQPGGFIQPVSN